MCYNPLLHHKSPGEDDPIASEEQLTGKDVGAENTEQGTMMSTVKSTLKSSAYLIFFRALPGSHPSRTAVPNKNKDWQILPRIWEGEEAHTLEKEKEERGRITRVD